MLLPSCKDILMCNCHYSLMSYRCRVTCEDAVDAGSGTEVAGWGC